jgi:hypothetical protein
MKKIGIVLKQQHVGHSFAPETEKGSNGLELQERLGGSRGLRS